MQAIIAFMMAVLASVTAFFEKMDITNDYVFEMNTSTSGEQVPDFASNVNLWDMGKTFYSPAKNEENDIFEFVKYVQLMQCSGGTLERDLFVNPEDKTVLDDYDFEPLIKNCAGILKLGALPHLKLGGVPLKYTSAPQSAVFADNIYPPDDYEVYYDYIYALAEALVNAFGKEQVLQFRFGVMTEYENAEWFSAVSGDALDSAEAYCKLYDYTVKALQDAIGKEVYVGAHSMTVTEGLWDEEIFIRHCAQGKNYATGETGTRLCYLSASFYDTKPGTFTRGKTLSETIEYLQNTAEKYGVHDLHYGVDEGRILGGNSSGSDTSDLLSRSVGYTWQGAYDARLYGQLWDTGADYFSYWSYLSEGLFKGNPTVSYHVSRLISQFEGSCKLTTKTVKKGCIIHADVKAYGAYDAQNQILRAYVYNFKNNLKYKRNADVSLVLNTPDWEDGEAKITLYRIDDDCNWFDEWCEDRETYGITDDCFSWCPEDGNITFLTDKKARQTYDCLAEKYAECAKLLPQTETVQIVDSKIEWNTTVDANTVLFITISHS